MVCLEDLPVFVLVCLFGEVVETAPHEHGVTFGGGFVGVVPIALVVVQWSNIVVQGELDQSVLSFQTPSRFLSFVL